MELAMNIPTDFDEPRERAEQDGTELKYTPPRHQAWKYAVYLFIILFVGILIYASNK